LLHEAALAADRWLALNPTSEQARRYAGVAALELHRPTGRGHCTTAETAYLSPAAGFLASLPVLNDQGTAPDVTELFRRLAARYPQVAEAQYALGSTALRSENYALALDSARRAVQIAPYWVPAKMLLARAQIASGHDEDGLATARDLAMAPDADVGTHLEYALLLASTDARGGARDAYAVRRGHHGDPGCGPQPGVLDLQRGTRGANAA
jgi:tetratricopeptide (TPR) repeat protein